MMQSNRLAKALIKKSIENGINDIKDNPKRGIRNLVDLGESFARTEYLSRFFSFAREELYDTDSVYYNIIADTARRVDADILTTFCMNIGYNCWVHGADIIREVESGQDFNVPWAMVFRDVNNAPSVIESVIAQGKALGIYMYIFIFPEGESDFGRLLDIFAGEKQCAFTIMVNPASVTSELSASVFKLKNTIVLLKMDGSDYSPDDDTKDAARILLESRCMFGGYSVYESIDSIIADEGLFRCAEELGMIALITIPNKISGYDIHAAEQKLAGFRRELRHNVFPIDLISDIVGIDRTISPQGCLATVGGDGVLSVYNSENGQINRGLCLQDSTLEDIFRHSLPKV